ncbi:MAG: rhomboid family intramembrane serine protease [Deltaproteobacteria bacterium]|nr:rhomboid family intramembrane serine protease [Deltaproteobacteria bacterium]
MKSSDPGYVPPPWMQPPEPPPEVQRAVALERAFFANLNSQKPWATYIIIGTCVFTFLLQLTLPHLDNMGVGVGQLEAHGQIWRLWSSTFLHGNLMHIASNMWVLYSLGRLLERVLGRPRFVVLYALSGLGGSILTGLLQPNQAVLGASGAIWGLITGALALAMRPHMLIPPMAARNMRQSLLRLVGLNAVISLLPGISALGHLGGGVAGFLLVLSGVLTLGAKATYAGEQESGASQAGWIVLAAISVVGMFGSVAVAVLLSLLAPGSAV